MVAPSVTYGVETRDMRMDERHKLEVMEMNCLWSSCRVTQMDRWGIEEVRPSDRVNGTCGVYEWRGVD